MRMLKPGAAVPGKLQLRQHQQLGNMSHGQRRSDSADSAHPSCADVNQRPLPHVDAADWSADATPRHRQSPPCRRRCRPAHSRSSLCWTGTS